LVGVGHLEASVHRLGVPAEGRVLFTPFCELPYLDAVGVGQQEDTLSSVRGTNASCFERAPLRSPPCAGKVSEDSGKASAGAEALDVLDEEQGDVGLVDDAPGLGPEPASVGGAAALAGDAVRLARDATSKEVHRAAPRAAVEGSKVRPERSRSQGLFFHPRHEGGSRIAFLLDVTNRGTGGRTEMAVSHLEGELDTANS
jgi:hypothetical protein